MLVDFQRVFVFDCFESYCMVIGHKVGLGIQGGQFEGSAGPAGPADPVSVKRQPKATCDVEDVDTIFVRKTLNGLEKEDHIIKLASNFCLVMLTPLFHEKEDLGIPWSCGRHIVLVV